MAQEPESITQIWGKEEIPDTAYLFRYIHKNHVKDQKPIPKAMDGGTGTSCDWDKYTTPEQTRALLAFQPKHSRGYKTPQDYFIVKLRVHDILEYIPSQQVEHAPIQNQPPLPDNRAHSHIVGEKEDVEVRLKFVDICEWAIALSDEFYL